uniref:FBA_2 domain-containing protein n=1 Tax=Steinernema glaseri TaxID=37863 RepID=A0A1I7Y887_9BILA
MDTVVRTFVDSVLNILSFSCLFRMSEGNRGNQLSNYWRRTAETVMKKRTRLSLDVTVSLKIPNGEDGVAVLVQGPHLPKHPIWDLHHYEVQSFYVKSEFTEEQMKIADKAIVLKKGFDSKEWSFLLDVVGRDCRSYYIYDLGEAFNSLNMASLNPTREDSGLKIENCAVDVNGLMFKWLLRMLSWSHDKRLSSLAFSQPVDIQDRLIDACVSLRNCFWKLDIWNCENMANLDVRFIKKLVEAFKNVKFDEYLRLDVNVDITKDEIDDLRSTILSHLPKGGLASCKVHWFKIRVNFNSNWLKFENGIARCMFRFSFN